jgi:SAM-dependent methyltransferase
VRRLAFHEALGVLNVGDLHPGGASVSEFLLSEMEKIGPRKVLEVGAGIGCTTQRMLRRGWTVTALEPSDVLRRRLEHRLGIAALPNAFETYESELGAYDAIVGESVFYGMDLRDAFAKVHRLLRPGGLFASLDTVWTEKADPNMVARIHDETKKTFGIPMASREALTWSDWKGAVGDAGFEEVAVRPIPPGSLRADGKTKATIIASAVRHPLALVQHLYHRLQMRPRRMPPGWTETWMAVWRRR